jgi:hypothetical protein
MRIRKLLAAVLSAAAFTLTIPSAQALDFGHPDRRPGVDYERGAHAVERYGHKYEYRYKPTGYYPFYNSGYWGPPKIKRFHGELPPYYAAWGANKRHYKHVEWHYRHHGGHWRGHW